MQNLIADLRYALRGFHQSPIFTLTAVVTLALGVGGTTAIFSLIHTVMLQSLPVADPAALYRIGDGNDCCVEGGPQDRWGMYSFPLFERLKTALPEFEQLTAFQAGGWRSSVRREGAERSPKPLRSEFVTGNYFITFGIRPFAGRLFSESDDRAGAAPVAVISYHTWQESYGGDTSVIGGTFYIEDHPFTLAGIAPPGFFGETLRSDLPDIWIPLHQEPLISGKAALLDQRFSSWLRVIGRLRPGATVNGIAPRLTTILRDWLQHDAGYPPDLMSLVVSMLPKQSINVVPAGAGVEEMKERYTRSLQILMSVCGLVLLIACANLANLMLARSMTRRTQTSLRIAIGASRSDIVRQCLTESLLLAVGGGLVGLLVADGAERLLLAMAFGNAKQVPIDTAPSMAVLAFAFGLSLVTGVLFGTAPAWFATRTDPVEALRGAGRSTADHSSFSRRALLVLQATLSVVLLAGATMLTRSLSNLEGQDLGFATKNRILIAMNALPQTYTLERLQPLYRNLSDKLNHLPGIKRASLAMYNPLTDNWGEIVYIAGHSEPVSEKSVASWDRVSPEYFRTVGQQILRGRGFTEADRGGAAPVAIVNEAFVKRFFPNVNPLDKHFGTTVAANANTLRIVGVVRDAKYRNFTQPPNPMFFVPLAQYVNYPQDMVQRLELRSHFISGVMLVTPASPGSLEPLLRKVFAEIDPNLTIISVHTMQQQIDLQFDQQRAVASLADLFGVVALILAAVGLYGVTAYAVAQRTGEIGVRIALGADRPTIVGMILRGAFNKVLAGLVLGVPLAIGAGRLLSSQLYEVTGWDPRSLLVAAGGLAICAFIASVIPAARASAIDPMQALRTE